MENEDVPEIKDRKLPLGASFAWIQKQTKKKKIRNTGKALKITRNVGGCEDHRIGPDLLRRVIGNATPRCVTADLVKHLAFALPHGCTSPRISNCRTEMKTMHWSKARRNCDLIQFEQSLRWVPELPPHGWVWTESDRLQTTLSLYREWKESKEEFHHTKVSRL